MRIVAFAILITTILLVVFLIKASIPPQFGPIMWQEHNGLPPVKDGELDYLFPDLQHHDGATTDDNSTDTGNK